MKYFILILFYIPLCSYAQRNIKYDKNAKLRIQYIDIKNTYINKVLVDFIAEQKLRNKLFRDEFGYITLEGIDFKQYNTLNLNQKSFENWADTLISFNISLNSYVINGNKESNCFNCDYFPPFYTKINGCLILIYDKSFDWLISDTNRTNVFTEKSKKHLTKLITKSLFATLDVDFVFHDPFLKTDYYLDKIQRSKLSNIEIMSKASFVYNNGININILRDGSIKIQDLK